MSVRVRGIKKIQKNAKKFIKANHLKLSGGVFEAGESIRRTALPITPREFGDLRYSSFTVSATNIAGNLAQASAKGALRSLAERGIVMAVTGYDTYYAVFVHEDMEARHKAPTSAKYLQKAAEQEKPRIVKNVAENAKLD